MIKKDNTSKQIRIYCLVVGIISFFIVSVCGQLLNRNTVNEEKMRAAFTAETTVNRIKSQLNRYLDVSEFFQNIIGSGHQMDSKEFQALSQMISDDSQIIKAMLTATRKTSACCFTVTHPVCGIISKYQVSFGTLQLICTAPL